MTIAQELGIIYQDVKLLYGQLETIYAELPEFKTLLKSIVDRVNENEITDHQKPIASRILSLSTAVIEKYADLQQLEDKPANSALIPVWFNNPCLHLSKILNLDLLVYLISSAEEVIKLQLYTAINTAFQLIKQDSLDEIEGVAMSGLYTELQSFFPVKNVFSIVLMLKQVEDKPELAKENTLYLKNDGSYISRFKGKLYQGSILQGDFGDATINLESLEEKILDPAFTNKIITITSKRGHTQPTPQQLFTDLTEYLNNPQILADQQVCAFQVKDIENLLSFFQQAMPTLQNNAFIYQYIDDIAETLESKSLNNVILKLVLILLLEYTSYKNLENVSLGDDAPVFQKVAEKLYLRKELKINLVSTNWYAALGLFVLSSTKYVNFFQSRSAYYAFLSVMWEKSIHSTQTLMRMTNVTPALQEAMKNLEFVAGPLPLTAFPSPTGIESATMTPDKFARMLEKVLTVIDASEERFGNRKETVKLLQNFIELTQQRFSSLEHGQGASEVVRRRILEDIFAPENMHDTAKALYKIVNQQDHLIASSSSSAATQPPPPESSNETNRHGPD